MNGWIKQKKTCKHYTAFNEVVLCVGGSLINLKRDSNEGWMNFSELKFPKYTFKHYIFNVTNMSVMFLVIILLQFYS